MQARQQSRSTSGLARLARVAFLAITAVTMSPCVDDGTTLCSTGFRCPTGYLCTYDGDGCRTEVETCGNNNVDTGEMCDDGNVQSGDGCRGDCTSVEGCGDGQRNLEEACDDGPNNGKLDSSCDMNCQVECGNGVLKETELCDRTLSRLTCLDFGFDRGVMGCDPECAPDTRDCAVIGWTPEDRVANTGDLHGMWGDTNGRVIAVGEDESGSAATIISSTGSSWNAGALEKSPGLLHDVWGSAYDDVFAVGSAGKALQSDGSKWIERVAGLDPQVTLRGVWTAGRTSDVIAVGDDAIIVRYRRSDAAWTRETLPSSVPADTVLEAVWGDGAAQLYAVGHAGGRGVIVRHTEQGWELDASELTTPGLLDVWGTAEGDVFAVGQDGVILRHDRASDTWTTMSSPTALTLHSLWGSSADHVFAVGDRGTVLFYDGAQWSALESATDLPLTAVWGTPFYGIAAAAENGRVFRYRDWSWLAASAQPEGGAIRSLWAGGLNDVYVLTEGVVYPQRFDGSTWSPMSEGFADLECLALPSPGSPSPLRHILGSTGGNLFAVGDGNVVLRYRPEQGWTCMTLGLPATVDVHRIWETDDAFRSLFAVGTLVGEGGGIVLRHDGRSWRELKRTDAPLRGIWGETANELFVVGDEGTILHYDNPAPGIETWQQIPCQLNASTPCGRLNAVWGRSRFDVHVVGENGVTLRFDSRSWSSPTVISSEHLLDLGGAPEHVFAVGASGSLFHHERGAWTPVHSGTDQKLTSVSGVDDPRAIILGGEGATVRRFVISDDVPISY